MQIIGAVFVFVLLSFNKSSLIIWLGAFLFCFCFCFGRYLNLYLCRLQLCLLAHASLPDYRVDPKQKKYSYDGDPLWSMVDHPFLAMGWKCLLQKEMNPEKFTKVLK